ncbi:hypothetical protein, partial [Candidatus Magnetominusculus dajiuhuensis]|uniref:hypothetical protein n=1 Tax=Candidatus Magnetominusculus dajiuhuensis TaxID=3137712 RepID=UPI003B42F124
DEGGVTPPSPRKSRHVLSFKLQLPPVGGFSIPCQYLTVSCLIDYRLCRYAMKYMDILTFSSGWPG